VSASFIILYDGRPVEIDLGVHLVEERFADRFTSEADAWTAAHREGLVPSRTDVVNLNQRHPKPIKA
jgi:hypothetical protein